MPPEYDGQSCRHQKCNFMIAKSGLTLQVMKLENLEPIKFSWVRGKQRNFTEVATKRFSQKMNREILIPSSTKMYPILKIVAIKRIKKIF